MVRPRGELRGGGAGGGVGAERAQSGRRCGASVGKERARCAGAVRAWALRGRGAGNGAY